LYCTSSRNAWINYRRFVAVEPANIVPILNVLAPRFTVEDDIDCCANPVVLTLPALILMLFALAVLLTPEIVTTTPLAGAEP
jgi:hypothetical protein